jgi:hypothetical protein
MIGVIHRAELDANLRAVSEAHRKEDGLIPGQEHLVPLRRIWPVLEVRSGTGSRRSLPG